MLSKTVGTKKMAAAVDEVLVEAHMWNAGA